MAFTRPKAAQIDFDITNITDPLIRLNSGETGSADKDVGIVIERGDDTNVAIIWDESTDSFAVINTSEDGSTNGDVTISSYADLTLKRVTQSEQQYTTSNMMKFNQLYTGGANGSYFTVGEYQKVVTIIPSAASQNYQVIGRMTAQNAGAIHTIDFNVAMRSETLPSLAYSTAFTEQYSQQLIKPQLWHKQTTTAGFIIAFEVLVSTLYGNVTVDIDVVPRASSQKSNVTMNTTQDSETTSVDAGYTAVDMTKVYAINGSSFTIAGAYSFPTSDGSADQVLATDGSGTLSFVDQTGGGGSGHTIQNAGSSLTDRANLNFDGTYLVATDDAGNDQTDVTIGSGVVTTTGTQTLTNKTLDVPTFTGNATFDTNTLFVDAANNRVGIGTTSPNQNLTVGGSASGTVALQVTNSTAGTAFNDGMQMFINDTAGGLNMRENYPLQFYVNGSERMRIDSSGNVGIGTSSPSEKLSVENSSDVAIEVKSTGTGDADAVVIIDAADTGEAVLEFRQDGVAKAAIEWYSAGSPDFNFRTESGTDGVIDFQPNNSLAMRIDSSGRVGIGTDTLSAALDIVASNNTRGIETTVNDTVADQTFYANLIDYNLSGSDATTADRTHVGLRLDIDSSASGGDTSDEHRIYGIWNDIDVTADSDVIYGTYSSLRTTHSTGTISDMRGAYNVVEADGTATVTNAYGSYNYALSGTTVSGLLNGYGSFNKYLKESADTSTLNNAHGVYAEVEIDAGTITNAYCVKAVIDRDGGTISNGILFRGEYQGTYASGTQWGIYISGEEKNYFSGDVGIGTTSPSTALEVNGTVTATTFDGVATSAQYADLAERYEADAEYPAGTVMIFGGEKEVTQSTSKMDRRKAGVVSEKPAYMMNCDLVETVEYAPYIALQGRVPVRVIGEVRKGDLMITSSLPGCAEAWREEGDPRYGSVIGKALANKKTTEEELIEVVVGVI